MPFFSLLFLAFCPFLVHLFAGAAPDVCHRRNPTDVEGLLSSGAPRATQLEDSLELRQGSRDDRERDVTIM